MLRAVAMRRDEGETLIELVVALAILGVAGVAILAGLMVSVKTSDMHRKEATGGAYVRTWGEKLQEYVDTNWKSDPCGPGAATYLGLAPDPKVVDPNAANYDASIEVKYLNDTGGWQNSCPGAGNARGMQQVKLTLRGSDGRGGDSLTFFFRQPCNASGANPCS